MARSFQGTLGIVVFTVLVQTFNAAAEFVKALFNITFLASSLGIFPSLPVAHLPQWLHAFQDVLSERAYVLLAVMTTGLETFSELVASISIPDLVIRLDWDFDSCGGYLSALNLLIIVGLTWVLKQLIGREWLFSLGIGSGKIKRDRGRLEKMALTAVVNAALGVFYYFIQVGVLQLFKTGTAGLSVSYEELQFCSTLDSVVGATVDAVYTLIFINILIWLIPFFAGSTKPVPKGLFMLMVQPLRFLSAADRAEYWEDIKTLLKMSVGWWDDEMVDRFKVVALAEKHDDDDTDDDNQHERVMMIIGRSRGLIWALVPGAATLAKFSEVSNNPTIFTRSDRLSPFRPAWKRVFIWIFNMIRMFSVVIFIFVPSGFLAGLIVWSIVPTALGVELFDSLKANLSPPRVNLPRNVVAPATPDASGAGAAAATGVAVGAAMPGTPSMAGTGGMVAKVGSSTPMRGAIAAHKNGRTNQASGGGVMKKGQKPNGTGPQTPTTPLTPQEQAEKARQLAAHRAAQTAAANSTRLHPDHPGYKAAYQQYYAQFYYQGVPPQLQQPPQSFGGPTRY